MEKNTQLTLMEFEKYCKELSPHEIIFDTHNQLIDPTNSTLILSLRFDIIRISYNPNRILLAQNEKNFFGKYINSINLCRIKSVIFKETIAGSNIFKIVCGDLRNTSNDITYNIILQ